MLLHCSKFGYVLVIFLTQSMFLMDYFNRLLTKEYHHHMYKGVVSFLLTVSKCRRNERHVNMATRTGYISCALQSILVPGTTQDT
jgi:hypothetical protein